jgi:hypothetical protein
MGKTARDLILELYKEDHITKQETDLLLDAISTKGDTSFIPLPYKDYTPNPLYDPFHPGRPWYTTSTTGTSPIKEKELNSNITSYLKNKKSLING